jgi:hypothetical protein
VTLDVLVGIVPAGTPGNVTLDVVVGIVPAGTPVGVATGAVATCVAPGVTGLEATRLETSPEGKIAATL